MRSARASGNAVRYVVALFVLDGWPFALLVLARRRGHRVAYARALAVCDRRRAGVARFLRRRPLGHDARTGRHGAALPETSVLFAALLGNVAAGEQFTVRRALGTCVIVAGVMALRLA